MMVKFNSLVILFTTIIGFVSCAYFSDCVKLVHFKKVKNGSDTFDIEYQIDGGKIFHGKTVNVLLELPMLMQLIYGADDSLYWVDFEEDEFQNVNSFSKCVRLAKRSKDRITMKNDFSEYTLYISARSMNILPYRTEWNLKDICFTRSVNDATFNYTITSTNNSRKYNGTTYLESNDTLVQRIHVEDRPQLNGVYQIEFTSDEFNSNVTFCKGITQPISEMGALSVTMVSNINPAALKSLIG